MLESVLSGIVSIGNFFVMDQSNWKRTVATEGKPHFEFFGQAWVCDVEVCFAYHIRLPQGFLH